MRKEAGKKRITILLEVENIQGGVVNGAASLKTPDSWPAAQGVSG